MQQPATLTLLITLLTSLGTRAQEVFVVQYVETDPSPRLAALTAFRSTLRAGGSRAQLTASLHALQSLGGVATEAFSSEIEPLGGEIICDYWLLGGAAVRLPKGSENQLRQLDCVRAVWRSRQIRAAGQIAISTNANNHNADFVHQSLQLRGQGVALALLDSGIDIDCQGTGQPHPAFRSRISKAVDIAQVLGPDDSHGHGTAVAGVTLAQDWQATNGKSDDGFAPDATVLSYKITHNAANDYFDHNLISAWQAVFLDKVVHPIAVANLSYRGSPSPLHPTQQVLDLVAFYADILVVTSAGNDAGQPDPTATSQANVSGLSVGANRPTIHRLTSFTSPGPLTGDPDRYFPDLTAMGEGLLTPKPDSKRGTSLPLSGTSFAAPAVAGTALLIRAAVPALSALETKALILNNTQDITANNPLLTRHHFGLGMLRSDYALLAAQNDQLWNGSLQFATPTAEVTINVVRGQSYSATATWPRMDVTTTAWDDLDLFVLDPQGKVTAASESPRNLYERVRFTALQTGAYKLRLTGSTLQTDGLGWSMTLGPNRGGGIHSGTYSAYGTNCVAQSGTADVEIAMPAITATRWGNDRTKLPLAGRPVRIQQAHSGSAIPQGLRIDRIAFRRDERDYGAPSFRVDLRLLMGHTTRAPDQLSTIFAQNPMSTMTVVLNQTAIDLPGRSGLPDDHTWYDYVLPLDTPFVTQTSATQNLLIEFEVRGNNKNSQPFGLAFDAELGSSLGRIVSAPGMPQATSGNFEARVTPILLISGASTFNPNGPQLWAAGEPQLGALFSVVLNRAPPSSTAILLHGISDTIWGASTLPFDLGPFGAPGCTVLSSSEWTVPATVNSAGQAHIDYTVPNQAVLSGAAFFNQFILIVPGANGLGTLSTNAGRARIGG